MILIFQSNIGSDTCWQVIVFTYNDSFQGKYEAIYTAKWLLGHIGVLSMSFSFIWYIIRSDEWCDSIPLSGMFVCISQWECRHYHANVADADLWCREWCLNKWLVWFFSSCPRFHLRNDIFISLDWCMIKKKWWWDTSDGEQVVYYHRHQLVYWVAKKRTR